MAHDVIRRVPASELSALLKVSLALSESLDLDNVLQVAIESAVEVLGLESGAIYLSTGPDTMRVGATTPPLSPDFPENLRLVHLRDHPHVARANSTGGPVFMDDSRTTELTQVERDICEARSLISMLYVPLMFDGAAVGTVIVGSTTKVHEFGDPEVALCRTLSAQIAMAIANARLYEQAQRAADELSYAYDATLAGWSAALEMRDAETLGHTERSARLAVELASSLGMPESELPHVRRGALLHDIGKMVIPDSVLNKPGPLDDEEWAVMRKHPEYAHEFLSRIEYLRPALDIPCSHHERWDGSGYPKRLAGEQIPLAARVFAVIDVYDALTSDRPYREAWTQAAALNYIETNAGTQFDPRVVELFLSRIGDRQR